MKVVEIVEPKFSHHKIKSTGDEFRKAVGVRDLKTAYGRKWAPNPEPKSKLIKTLGHGQYASAVGHENHPTNAMKISRGTSNPDHDPYFQFVKALALHKEENPYFPIIYSVKVYETTNENPEEKFFYVVNMEKLLPLQSLTDAEIRTLIVQITKPKTTLRLRQALSNFDPATKLQGVNRHKLTDILVSKIREGKVQDPQLVRALDLINIGERFTSDITEYNLMIRRAHGHIQLVLADPVRDY